MHHLRPCTFRKEINEKSDIQESACVGGVWSHLAGSFLDELLVGELEGAAQGLGGVLVEHLLPHQVDVEVVGGIDRGVHPSVAIKHCEVRLLLLVLPAGGDNTVCIDMAQTHSARHIQNQQGHWTALLEA